VQSSDLATETPALTFVRGINRFDVPRGETCALCSDPKRKTIVRIDEQRYTPRVPVEPRHMLRHDFASRHRSFWHVVSEQDAARVHCTDAATGSSRHLHIALDVTKLLQHKEFWRECVGKLRAHANLCDVVVIPEHGATTALRELAEHAYYKPMVVMLNRGSFERPEDDREQPTSVLASPLNFAEQRARLKAAFEIARQIVILDDVVIHGRTLRAIHRYVQDTMREVLSARGEEDRDYEVRAFAVVGRPSSADRLNRLQISMRQRGVKDNYLACGIVTVLPDETDTCPWCDERDELRAIHLALADDGVRNTMITAGLVSLSDVERATGAVRQRLRILEDTGGDGWRALQSSLFLCRPSGSMTFSAVPERLSPHSLFGERLTEAAAYAAVACAMQEIRDEARAKGAAGIAWETPKILTAYHDPLLSAAFLRASRREEITMVENTTEFDESLSEVTFVSTDSNLTQSAILAGEIEWCVLTGKLPAGYRERVRRRVGPILQDADRDIAAVLNTVGAYKHGDGASH